MKEQIRYALYISVLFIVSCQNVYHAKEALFISDCKKFFVWGDVPVFLSNDRALIMRIDLLEFSDGKQAHTYNLRGYDQNFGLLWSQQWKTDTICCSGLVMCSKDSLSKLYLPISLQGDTLISVEVNNTLSVYDTVAMNTWTGEKLSKSDFRRELFPTFDYNMSYQKGEIIVNKNLLANVFYAGKQMSFSLLEENEVFLSATMELEEGFIYNNPTNEFPFLVIRGENSFLLFDLNQKINWTVDSLPYSFASTVSYEPGDSLIYLQHGRLYCINKNTGKLRFKSEEVFSIVGGYRARIDLKKWIYKDRILAIDIGSIGIFDRYSGKLKNLTKFDNEDIVIKDATIFNNELVMITSDPVMLLRIPVDDLLKKKNLILSTEGFRQEGGNQE